MILNDRIRNSLHDTVMIKCQVCASPQVELFYWLRNDRTMVDEENIEIKTQILDEQCSQSLISIFVSFSWGFHWIDERFYQGY